MTNELGSEANLHSEDRDWALGRWSGIPLKPRRLRNKFL